MKQTPSTCRRRDCLKAGLVAATMVLYPVLARSAAKASRQAAQYVNHPVDGKMCAHCRFFIPRGASSPGRGMMGGPGGGMMGKGGMMQPGTCEVVEGDINPMAYCALYVAAQK